VLIFLVLRQFVHIVPELCGSAAAADKAVWRWHEFIEEVAFVWRVFQVWKGNRLFWFHRDTGLTADHGQQGGCRGKAGQ